MNLALALQIMDHVDARDGDLSFDSEDLAYYWYEAWFFFWERRKGGPSSEQGYPHKPLEAASPVRPHICELVDVFRILNGWYEEALR